jgi:cob(I)alamin adenosyltransferase
LGNKVQVYTGDGKGKTTAALGLIVRFLGAGGKACLIQFDKGSQEGKEFYSERRLLRTLPGLTFHPTGLPRFDETAQTFRFENIPEDRQAAEEGLGLARRSFAGDFGLVVLDEVLSLVMTGLASREEILALLADYEAAGRPCELVLTGHLVWPELVDKVDLITEMKKVKHYFESGESARKGIEY